MRTEARGISLNQISLLEQVPSSAPDSILQGRPSGRESVVRLSVFGLLAVAGLAWDLWSKWYVFDQLGPLAQKDVWTGSVLGVPVQFELATTFNHGALWGIGQNQTWLFASLSFVALGVISYFVWNRLAVSTWFLTIATGLLLAGTLGNLYDRLGLHGWKDNAGTVYAVRDFLDFVFFNGGFHWATFNFADTYLVTGAIMLVVQSLFTPQEESAIAKQA